MIDQWAASSLLRDSLIPLSSIGNTYIGDYDKNESDYKYERVDWWWNSEKDYEVIVEFAKRINLSTVGIWLEVNNYFKHSPYSISSMEPTPNKKAINLKPIHILPPSIPNMTTDSQNEYWCYNPQTEKKNDSICVKIAKPISHWYHVGWVQQLSYWYQVTKNY